MAARTLSGGDLPLTQKEAPRRAKAVQTGLKAQVRSFRRLPRDLQTARLLLAVKRRLVPFEPGMRSRAAQAGNLPLVPPQDPWPGDAANGAAILQGRFTLAGRCLVEPYPMWSPRGASAAWRRELHSFSWLRDLRASGGDAARRSARDLTLGWIEARPAAQGPAYDPVVVGERLATWLGFYDFFVASGEIEFRTLVLESLERQARILNRLLPAGLTGADLVTALKGLIYAGCSLPGRAEWRNRGVLLLERELPRQILADGGHIERSPARHLAVLRDLVDLRALLQSCEIEPPPALVDAITTMAPVLRLWRHGDGGLALFNDTGEAEDLQIDMVLQRCPGPKRPHMAAPDSGYYRLQAGRSVVIVDAGRPPGPGLDDCTHAGTGSFELSVGRERVIVNCGAQSAYPDWVEAQKATAGHSTLVIENTNSSELLPGGGLGRRPGAVSCRREEVEGHLLLEFSHDGYAQPFGLRHRRRLYLSPKGDDFRGEDSLEAIGQAAPGRLFHIRFHLHPDIRASLAQAGGSLFLCTPKGSGWRLRTSGVELSLEPSIYLGRNGEFRRSQQIVLSGRTAEAATAVKWAFHRESAERR